MSSFLSLLNVSAGARRLGDLVALNPQPLPPREVSSGALAHVDDFCGTVPRPFPVPPLPTPFGAALPLHEMFGALAQR